MKKEIDRLLTEEIPKLAHFDLVTSVEVKGQFYICWRSVLCYQYMQNYLKQDIEWLNNPINFLEVYYLGIT